ncbi:phenylacetate--CoA ligase family protein [Rhodococcus wratislaviensis]|uniref:Acyl-protein synthetase LuxE domain-containing protein n=1 Tax=Rhodococcus wratislaviensis NBRC 100605 TaxID=1219028 RepID=X0PWF6_RHOWR|nr:hypothetical protein [Rhodococcus wratislaviensis]GAF47623.1 hypothetical protein RW1_043_00580 [Rhodococcus wratislaviensis NBRC 100605]
MYPTADPAATRDLDSEVDEFLSSPADYFGWKDAAVHSIPRDKLEALQLRGAQVRFDYLRDRVPVLKKLTDEQKVDGINSVNDLVPLLFSHTMYKSYPLTLLKNSRFDLLTGWLQKLTTVDLSGFDTEGLDSIDSWISALDGHTDLRVRHSSGTSGHMSFIPRTSAESDRHFYSMMLAKFDRNGVETPRPDKALGMHVVMPVFRSGNTGLLRANEYFIRDIAGNDEEKLHFLYPGHQSSDLMFLAGQIGNAEALGSTHLNLSPSLIERRDEFEALAANRQMDTDRFFDAVVERLKGKRIWGSGTWNVLYRLAISGRERGASGVLDSKSIIQTGGGAKGQTVPADWEPMVCDFLGVEKLNHTYGMTEVMAGHALCEHDRFHIEPWTILFVLDPDTGYPMPRTGVQTGRAAFFDLLSETYWGGFVSGDEVTVDWTSQCACGRTTVHIAREIERYGADRGGDDKITCAASADAHDSALAYLNDLLQ